MLWRLAAGKQKSHVITTGACKCVRAHTSAGTMCVQLSIALENFKVLSELQ